MNLQKIKAALKKNPATEFIYSTSNGDPDPRWSKKATIISPTRLMWSQFPGYSDSEIPETTALSLAGMAEMSSVDTTDYYIVIKIEPTTAKGKAVYVATKPRNIRGFYVDVEQLWAKEVVIRGRLDELREQHNQIVAEQVALTKTKESLVKKELDEMLLDVGFTQDELNYINIRADIDVRFAEKYYPELEHLQRHFTYDLEKYEVKVTYRALDVPMSHLHAFSEVIHQLRQTNLELSNDLEKEKRLNARH
jgi:hypothetical protein